MSTTTKNNTAEIDGVCDMLHNMGTAENEDIISICANCGKESTDVTNTCNKCKSVKYCNAACKKKHRQKHKKECERRVAELHDEALFKQPPSKEDCPICMIPLPPLPKAQTYMMCCGKVVCRGCIYAVQSRAFIAGREEEDGICPFCRNPPPPTSQDMIKMYNKRVELNDANAIYSVGIFYELGSYGLPQSHTKALKLYLRAAELGNSTAYYMIGLAYEYGKGVEVDMKQAKRYYELAAKEGHVNARHDLGVFEEKTGNMDRALKHYMIAVECGERDSLQRIKELFMNGHAVTEDEFKTALRAYQSYIDEISSEQRDEAAAINDDYKYFHSAF